MYEKYYKLLLHVYVYFYLTYLFELKLVDINNIGSV